MKFTGRLEKVERLANSKEGNPRYHLSLGAPSPSMWTGSLAFVTADNTSDAYLINTSDVHSLVEIELDKENQVFKYKRLPDPRCETCGDLRYRCTGH